MKGQPSPRRESGGASWLPGIQKGARPGEKLQRIRRFSTPFSSRRIAGRCIQAREMTSAASWAHWLPRRGQRVRRTWNCRLEGVAFVRPFAYIYIYDTFRKHVTYCLIIIRRHILIGLLAAGAHLLPPPHSPAKTCGHLARECVLGVTSLHLAKPPTLPTYLPYPPFPTIIKTTG